MAPPPEAELRKLYAARYPDFRLLSGPLPSSHAIVMALAAQYGMDHGRHRLDGWHSSGRNGAELTAVCAKCGARAFATSRKTTPAMVVPGPCPKP